MNKIEHLKSISEGVNDSYICNFNGRLAFVKYCVKNPFNSTLKFLKVLDSNVQSFLKSDNYPLSYRCEDLKHSHIEKEVLTYNLWKKHGIEVPEILYYDDSTIVLNLISGGSVGSLTKNKFDLSILEKTIDVFSKTRYVGKKLEDSCLFHSDPHLDNFMINEDNGLIVPIDSSLKLRGDFSVNKLDSLINSYFAFNLLDRVNDYSLSEISSVFDSYRCSLSSCDIINLKKKSNVSLIFDKYMILREEFAHRIKRREKVDICQIYSKKRHEKLCDLISSMY